MQFLGAEDPDDTLTWRMRAHASMPVVQQARPVRPKRPSVSEQRLREAFAKAMAGDLNAPATLTQTAGQVLEDALAYRDFMQRAMAILARCPEAQQLIEEAGAHWAWLSAE